MVGAGRRFRCDHHRDRLVLDLDQLGRIFGDVPALRDDECDRLARVANDIGGEAPLGAALGQVGMRDEQREVDAAERKVRRGVDGDDAWHRARSTDVDRRDARMRVGRAHEAAFECAFIDVVGEAAVTTEEAVVLDPLHRRAKPSGRHFKSSTERVTARRIEA